MMSILVFLVLLFGLFGVLSGQYITQYREAYYLWIKYIVYDKYEPISPSEKRDLCSKLESYSREICELADMILLLFILMSFTFCMLIITIELNIPLLNSNPAEKNIVYVTELLAFILYISMYVIMRFLKINLIHHVSKTSAIDEKIFRLWFELKCHDCKEKLFQNYPEPHRLYEIVAEKLDLGEIEASAELKEMVKPFRKKATNQS